MHPGPNPARGNCVRRAFPRRRREWSDDGPGVARGPRLALFVRFGVRGLVRALNAGPTGRSGRAASSGLAVEAGGPRTLDGDESPSESADKSAHSKVRALRRRHGEDTVRDLPLRKSNARSLWKRFKIDCPS